MPGSGKGIVIGYATSLEAVPIVHVISNGIKAQAKRAGVKLIFCDTGGDIAKALDCAKSMKAQGAKGVLQFQHDAKASPKSGEPAKAEPGKAEAAKPDATKVAAAGTTGAAGAVPATLLFAVQPWGEIFVNGKSQGVTPPKKSIKLDPGKYKVEIRNTTFPPHVESLELKARDEVTVRHRFQ